MPILPAFWKCRYELFIADNIPVQVKMDMGSTLGSDWICGDRGPRTSAPLSGCNAAQPYFPPPSFSKRHEFSNLRRRDESGEISSGGRPLLMWWPENATKGGGALKMEKLESQAVTIAQLYPKQHKMGTQYKANSLLITLAGWAAT